VELWFAELTNRELRRPAHRIVTEMEARHPRLDRCVERRPETLRLDQDRRRDSRRIRRLLPTN
jgi:hypothetical protein